ncbi:MAG: PAS domain-containing protein [Ignavibacteriales bacterium]|nr:PAS domain-containing protein [Ignavibacteriales bacterium]
MAPSRPAEAKEDHQQITRELKKIISLNKNDSALILNSWNKIIYCSNSAAGICKKKNRELINSVFPYKISNGKISVPDGKKKEIYNVNTIAVKLQKEKFKLIILNKIVTAAKNGGSKKSVISNEKHINEVDKLASSLPDIFFRMNKDGTILDYKAGSVTDLYMPPEKFLGKQMHLVLPESVGTKFKTALKEISKGKELVIIEYELLVAGKVKSFEARILPSGNNEIISFVRDITRRKLIEKSLQHERILLRTVINNIPDAIYAKDLNYCKTLANRTDLENMGCTGEEDAIGKSDFDFFPKEVAETFFADDQRVIKYGKAVINREEFFYDKNGNKKWLLTSKVPLRSNEGKIIGLVGIGHDITNRKKAERTREILYNVSEAAYAASDMSALYKRIHETIARTMPVKNIYIALYDEKKELISFPYFVDEFDPPIPTKKPGRGLTEYVLRNGNALLADQKKINELIDGGEVVLIGTMCAVWLGIPLKLSGKTIGVIVVQDYENEKAYGEEEKQLLIFVSEQIAQVIERQRNSDAIKKYADELKQLNQTKDKFFSIIAHDLKNPFITILGFSDLLISDYAELSDDEKLYYVSEMKKSAEVSHNLLQNLLQWSRSQTGRIDFNPQKLDLHELINANFLLLEMTAQKKQIQLQHQIKGQQFIFADKDMIDTVLRNLLTNAIKFSDRNSAISVNAAAKEDFMEIEVADSGIGMDKKTIENLFKLDATHSSSGTENESGTGLGLILCKEFVEKNCGTIRVESEQGKGSRFIFSLPVHKE